MPLPEFDAVNAAADLRSPKSVEQQSRDNEIVQKDEHPCMENVPLSVSRVASPENFLHRKKCKKQRRFLTCHILLTLKSCPCALHVRHGIQ